MANMRKLLEECSSTTWHTQQRTAGQSLHGFELRTGVRHSVKSVIMRLMCSRIALLLKCCRHHQMQAGESVLRQQVLTMRCNKAHAASIFGLGSSARVQLT